MGGLIDVDDIAVVVELFPLCRLAFLAQRRVDVGTILA
jgi:hypothetical protein